MSTVVEEKKGRESLTKYELETIVNYNDDEKEASVYTHNLALQRRMDKLCVKHPEIFKLQKQDDFWGSKTYVFPKKYVTIREPRILTEEQKLAGIEKAKKMREAKNQNINSAV